MNLKPLVVMALAFAVSACTSSNTPSTPGNVGSGKDQSPKKEERFPPCHPGCFPAGTVVATQDGPRAIESLGRGDIVVLVGADGTQTSGMVSGTFKTRNLILVVRTELGNLMTTETQPLCLVDGGFRDAGELKAGDAIWQWEQGQRRAALVRTVAPTGLEVPVFNLVVGESAVFVAGGFLARGKPPSVSDTDVSER